MIAIYAILEVMRLHFLTHWSYRQIADYLHVSHQSVSRYVRKFVDAGLTWPMLKGKSEHEVLALLEQQKKPRRSKKIHPDYALLAKSVDQGRKGSNKIKPHIIQHLAKHGDHAVSESSIYKGVREARKYLLMSMTQIFTPGRSMHIDYAGLTLTLKNGLMLYFFVAVWAYSKLVFFRATSNQTQSSWLTSIDAALQKYGVKPVFIVSDNATPLFSFHKDQRKITDGYDLFIRHHDVVADPIDRAKPKQNQPAEQAVKIFTEEVYPILLQLDCTSEDELNEQLDRIADQINKRHMPTRNASRLELFEQEEKTVCKPCNPHPFESAVSHRSVTIGKHYRFCHDGVFYSVPQECHWQKVHLEVYLKKIVVRLGNKVAWVHERQPKCGRHIMLSQHMPPQHKILLEENKQYFVDWGGDRDENLARMMKAQYLGLCDTDFYARRQCKRIKHLFEQYDKQGLGGDFVAACFICIEAGRANVTMLESVLKDDVVNNDELMASFEAFYAAKQIRNQGDAPHVH